MQEPKTEKKIELQKEIVKVTGMVVLYFEIDLETKTVALIPPPGNSDLYGYFSPLSRSMDPKRHEGFLETYQRGIAYCKKLLKSK